MRRREEAKEHSKIDNGSKIIIFMEVLDKRERHLTPMLSLPLEGKSKTYREVSVQACIEV